MDAPLKFRIHVNTFVFFLFIMRSTNPCPESKATVNYVNSCPRTAEKRAEAAKRLNCQSISTNCTKFVYHCVPNHFRTRMIEVCAQEKLILKNVCVEYNERGNVIQRNRYAKCKACPKMYKSTNVFQYPECFKIKTKLNTTSAMTTTLSQRNESSSEKTISDESLYINTTAFRTSNLQHSIDNSNTISQTDSPISNTSHTSPPRSFSSQNWSELVLQVSFGTIIIVIGFSAILVIIVIFIKGNHETSSGWRLNPRNSEFTASKLQSRDKYVWIPQNGILLLVYTHHYVI